MLDRQRLKTLDGTSIMERIDRTNVHSLQMLPPTAGPAGTFYPSFSSRGPIPENGSTHHRPARDRTEDPAVGAGRPIVAEQDQRPTGGVHRLHPFDQQPGRLPRVADGDHIPGAVPPSRHDQKAIARRESRLHARAPDHHPPAPAGHKQDGKNGSRPGHPKR
jgi:hypothetical protein